MNRRSGLFHPGTRARATDPATSHAAIDGVELALIQRRVLALFNSREYSRDDYAEALATHRVLIEAYRKTYGLDVSESTVRTRVSELVALGLMADSNLKVGNGRHTLWILTEAGKAACRRLATNNERI